MKVRISSLLLDQIMSLAVNSPHEICGLLLGEAGCIREILPAANVAPDPARHFEVDPMTLITAHRAARKGEGGAIIGSYHSHPGGNPEPSAADAASAAADGSLWLIVGRGTARLWIAGPGQGGSVRFTPAALDMM